jgi:integrase
MNEANPARMFYVNLETSARILKACPTMSWKCIFTLARFCGMRSPSEVLALKWTDVDFARGRLRIDSSKTGLRYCPLFPHVRELLLEARQEAENVTGVCDRGLPEGANLGTQFGRIVRSAGVEPWPKIFHNLRSSCRTDLQDQFPQPCD